MSSWQPFNRGGVALLVPPRPGVYAIARGSKVIYVGQSLNLQDRLGDHLSERDNPLLALMVGAGGSTFVYAEVNPALLDLVERAWIAQYQPVCNRKAA